MCIAYEHICDTTDMKDIEACEYSGTLHIILKLIFGEVFGVYNWCPSMDWHRQCLASEQAFLASV